MGDVQLTHNESEAIPIFGQINGFRRCAHDLYAHLLQFSCNIQGRLSPKLDNNAFGFLLFIDAQNIFNGKRLKIEFIRCVVIRRYCFRVAVNHNRFITCIADGQCSMHAAVIKLNALTNTVGSTTQNHYFFTITDRNLVRRIVGGIVIGCVFNTAYRYRFPGLMHVQCLSLFTDSLFRQIEQLGQIAICKTVLFGFNQ